ncbi:MAG: hypothetical protein HZC28_12270 [Spirochaetes bacterium]|nr:hypothetical protein [Spirochaetota bacterium]
MGKKRPMYKFLLGLTIVFTLLAIITVIPMHASKVCRAGYMAHCSFTPISTLILICCSAVTCIIRKRVFSA